MLFEDYRKLFESFKGVLKNYPEDNESLKTHFSLISVKIKHIDIFKKCLARHLESSDFFPSHLEIFSQLNYIISNEPKTANTETTYEMGKRINWLIWDIEQKVRDITDYQKRNLPRAVKICNRELKELQTELDWRQGRISKPVSKFDSMSQELKNLYDNLYNKQIALVACKENANFCDRLKIEIRQIEIEISKQERLEGVNKPEEIEVPF